LAFRPRAIGKPGDETSPIVRIAAQAQFELGSVPLGELLDQRDQPGGPTNTDDEHASGKRIERAGVPDSIRSGQPGDDVDNVAGCNSRGLVETKHPRKTLTGHYRLASIRCCCW
jgi:hypothetical protein